MGYSEKNQDQEWIERVKSEGDIPLLEPDNCSNGWASPPGDIFLVRGPEYLKTKAKIPGGDYLLKPIGFDWIKGTAKVTELLRNPKNRVRRILDVEFSKGSKPFVWAFNLQVPSKDNYSAVAYFVDSEPRPEDSLITRFINGDDVFRNSRLKLIANIVQGPWIVRKAVGEQAICIIGRALTCMYSTGENFMEVDIDIGSSMVANAIVHLAFGYLTTLTVDLAFLIEGQTESELPERILGAVRFSELNTASARSVELPSEESAGNLQSSLPTSFWKSVGQGFSQLLNSSGQGSDSNSIASYVSGVIDHDKNNEDLKNQ
ncbi:protein ENHANCED DISEASE RESISTANCE 2 [Primulina tabacum]|uniref:protein ENHANCED DISEASE RESISTANCE 2 n=1 Tax=Primulina tabacum TaxID=48773 RepID=UPI003F5ACAE9